jgi:hypothetical protein
MIDEIDDKPKSGEKRAVGPGKPPVEHQFKLGNHGGPGHPKGVKNFMSRVNKFGRWKTPEKFIQNMVTLYPDKEKELSKMIQEDAAALRFWIAVISGEPWAIKELFNRKDGFAKQHIDLTSLGEKIQAAPIINVLNQKTADIVTEMLKEAEAGNISQKGENEISSASTNVEPDKNI